MEPNTDAPTSFTALQAAIAQRQNSLSPRLRQIAEYALSNPNDMALETVAQIAERAGVQPSALIRFSKTLGFDGFTEMQRVFRTRLTDNQLNYKDRIRALSDGGGLSDSSRVLEHFINAGAQALEELRREIDPAALDQAIDRMEQADHIYVMGQRRSFPVAAYLGYALGRLGRRTILLDGLGGMLRQQVQAIGDRDLLVAVSFKPYSDDTVEVCRLAAGNGVPVVGITDGTLSPIAPLAGVTLKVEDAQVKGFRSLTATMCLAVGLIVALGQRLDRDKPGR
ncbi:transcriptional regulator (plasmid) [Azospirillum sp. B510]|uniref:MurR/RpiR family transcriptional regulator n=1 Tax=Azospirillum sp. (strain B510) TaxID=137722 RepID=UPI0001C4CA98|nr:MurR/RpiR family transcriptional regulator [Azospirillum sp. B510]BAI74759.1 transcriptional regulator [Azospirillum sp. B510]